VIHLLNVVVAVGVANVGVAISSSIAVVATGDDAGVAFVRFDDGDGEVVSVIVSVIAPAFASCSIKEGVIVHVAIAAVVAATLVVANGVAVVAVRFISFAVATDVVSSGVGVGSGVAIVSVDDGGSDASVVAVGLVVATVCYAVSVSVSIWVVLPFIVTVAAVATCHCWCCHIDGWWY
jgi:hypothetical protein